MAVCVVCLYPQVGTEWADVGEEIRKAHYQPLLLVYTNPFAEAMDLSGVQSPCMGVVNISTLTVYA